MRLVFRSPTICTANAPNPAAPGRHAVPVPLGPSSPPPPPSLLTPQACFFRSPSQGPAPHRLSLGDWPFLRRVAALLSLPAGNGPASQPCGYASRSSYDCSVSQVSTCPQTLPWYYQSVAAEVFWLFLIRTRPLVLGSARYRGKGTDLSKVAAFQKNEADTGSTAGQIARLSARVEQLSEHLNVHKKVEWAAILHDTFHELCLVFH